MLLFTDFLWFSATFLVASILTRLMTKKTAGRKYPPSLPSLPFIGALPFMWKFNSVHNFFISKAKELGPIFTFRAGSSLCLTLNSKESIQEALVNHSACFAGRASFYMERVTNKNGKGIAGRNYSDDFKNNHKLSLSVLKEFGFGTKCLMENRILEESEAMDTFIRAKQGKAFDPTEMARLGTYNVIKNILFGKREDYENGPDEMLELITSYIQNLTFAVDIAPALLELIPYFRRKVKFGTNAMARMCDIIKEEIEHIKKNGQVECFVSSYLAKVGPDYDHEQLIYTARDVIGAGSETTSTTLLWLLMFLANNQSIQERLQKEIDEVIPKHRLPSLDDQPKLPFVEATILEIMRFRTIVPIAIPHLTLCDSEVCGYFIPAGTQVFPNIIAAHVDPKVWKDPDVFRPDRFLDDDNKIVGKDRIIPFSLGRRSCLGEMLARQEIFLFLTGWIQRFDIKLGEDGKQIDEKPLVEASNIPRPFMVRIIPRAA
jgi:cytochrome P450